VFDGHFDTQLQQYLASRMVELVARYNRLPDMSRADIDLLAADIASFIAASWRILTMLKWVNTRRFTSGISAPD
jgi:hypothetical protein